MRTFNKKYKFKTQLDLFKKTGLGKLSFGGSHLNSHPKIARPFSSKQLIHVVLKSEKAKGAYSFLRFEREILKIIKNLEGKLGVAVKDVVVMGNHVHLSLKAISGLIARCVLKAEKGKASQIQNFFRGRPFSRLVALGRKSFEILSNYFQLNRFEKMGIRKGEGRTLLKEEA